MKTALELKNIYPQGGDRRDAFEELSFQLFAQHCTHRGPAIRRSGAGGDAGLEGIVTDAQGRVIAGVQAKFFNEKLGSTQWKNLDESIRTALTDNASEGAVEEIFVTLPCNLTQAQFNKWTSLCESWKIESRRLKYPRDITFTLWDESYLRGALLTPSNRGLLLHYFEFPDFDRTHCWRRSSSTVVGLADRYLPDLHTATAAEDKLHVFLRSERFRQQYFDEARDRLRFHSWLPEEKHQLPEALQNAFTNADVAWRSTLPPFGDGVSLPASFAALSAALDNAAEALVPLMQGLSALVPPRKSHSNDEYSAFRSRGPHEEMLQRFDRWEFDLRSLARYLRENSLADQPCLLLTGEPGTGKTHLLAEVCSRYGEQGGVVLFTEGSKFSTDESPWTQFIRWAGFPGHSARDLIETLSAMRAGSSLPTLICIDALNETPNRALWRNGLIDFVAELRPEDHVKLLVSCRSDYLEQTLPATLREHHAEGWGYAEHQGLGVEVFEAFPKYVAAYDVRWHGLPPLVQEFRNPLFLRIFCEAYKGQTPHGGSLSLGTILGHYARRKAKLLGERIDCDPSRALDALRDIAECIRTAHALQIPERDVRDICERHHSPTETSRSLYRALLSEGILVEFPGPTDLLGSHQLVRFTYERVWDYFVSLNVLPPGAPLSADLVAKLRDSDWRWENSGLISLLNVRCPEEGHGELCDIIAPDGHPGGETLEQFLESLPWRTDASVSKRTMQLFELATNGGAIEYILDHVVPLAPNSLHPWNANWLHERLAALPLAERDRTWTFWVNKHLYLSYEDSPLRELMAWAERAPLEMLTDGHRLLLATVLGWCSSTTFTEGRKRLAAAITRLLVGRTQLAAQLVARFLPVDDTYVREWVLLAAAGAAQHASTGDTDLGELACIVHASIFAGETVEPHLLIRHYATEICQQAEAKGVLPTFISHASFHPPFHSRWPRVWSEKQCEEKNKGLGRSYKLFSSVIPDSGGPGYGDWGRYVMQGYVEQFSQQKLSKSQPTGKSRIRRFNAETARRYVIQRVFEFGWDAESLDDLPDIGYRGHGPNLERISKKYQWIALYEFLGFLSDHYIFHNFNDSPVKYQSARQIIGSSIFDPFVTEPPPERIKPTWHFVRESAPWWRGHLDLLPRPMGIAQQRESTTGIEIFHPATLLALNDGRRSWFTLSAFHEWKEPQPVWTSGKSSPHINIQTAIQSYLVSPSQTENLLRQLSERGFCHNSRLWLQEPDFGQPLARLCTFPLNQEKLRLRCELDEQYGTESWHSGACSTTCRCASNEDQRRAPDGSMPSPQLAEIGGLRWLGNAFDFASPGESEPLICHVGRGSHGACIVRRDALLNWLRKSKKNLVWRCYIHKFLHDAPDHNHMRAYWGTFLLRPNGSILHFGGATCTFPHGPGPEEPLPWAK